MTQQELAKLLIESVNLWVVTGAAVLSTLSYSIGLFTSAAIAANWISADSGWAKFIAKLCGGTMQAKSGSALPKKSMQAACVEAVIEESKGDKS